MKKSEAFKMAQVAVLNSELSIPVKTKVLEMLLEEEYFAKIYETHMEEKRCDTSTVE